MIYCNQESYNSFKRTFTDLGGNRKTIVVFTDSAGGRRMVAVVGQEQIIVQYVDTAIPASFDTDFPQAVRSDTIAVT